MSLCDGLTDPCALCGELIDPTELHHVVHWNRERFDGEEVVIRTDDIRAFMHLKCGDDYTVVLRKKRRASAA